MSAAAAQRLPSAAFEDQNGQILHLDSVRGSVVVVVYGGRAGLDSHKAWGQRLDQELRSRGIYTLDQPAAARPVRILALAQMGNIPHLFRALIRKGLSRHVEVGHSLWLDWEDLMSARFGAREPASSVVVADQSGVVRLVVSGSPEGAPYRAVTDLVLRLL